jgi:proliferating cell nuclear antigen
MDAQEQTTQNLQVNRQDDAYKSMIFGSKGYEELKNVLESMNTLVDEINFEIDEDSLRVRCMDPSHIALIDVVLPNAMFDYYEVAGKHNFGVRGAELLKVLKTFDPKETLKVLINDGELELNGYEEKANMRLIETGTPSTPLPKLNFNTKVTLGNNALKKLEKIQVVSEYVTFTSERTNKITMFGKGDSGSKTLSFEHGSDDVENIEIREESKATYSLDYLLKITKIIAKNSGSATFEYSSKMPLRVEQRIGTIGRIHFYLAPRVQD